MNELPIIPPADITPQQLYAIVVQTNIRITAQNEKIDELTSKIDEMARAWQAASMLVAFVKIVGSVAAAVAAVWGAVRIFKGMG